MNTTELGQLLRGATDGLEPPRGFAHQVLAGGRRRRLRRRLTVAASAVAVLAVAAAGTVVALDREHAPDAAQQLLNTPTKGELAGDRAFQAEVIRAWEEGLTIAPEASYRYYDDLRGEPHILWAGNTPAGRAAVVVQQTYVHRDYWVHFDGLGMAKGLIAVDPADGRLKLVGTLPVDSTPGSANYFMFGRDDETMLIVDEGKPLYYSTKPRDASSDLESYRPEWRRIQASHGVALVSIPGDLDPGPAGITRRLVYQGDHPPDVVGMDTRSFETADAASIHLDHLLLDPDDRLPIPNFFGWRDKWTLGTPISGVDTADLERSARPKSAWQIIVWRPDRVFLVREVMNVDDRNLSGSTGSVLTVGASGIGQDDPRGGDIDVGKIDHDAVLPVRYRLPDGGGWVVARKGQPLSYRTQGGQWHDAGRDAALLPDDAVEVKVGEDVVTL
ncbi:hypothetical protein [Actinophytocola oryzae]|uniref:Uncharacterized protein n=1 Tax=Actinophytocola oryzae TaxID=502181 RepID=A0A4R7VXQ8_9PSEU|nr:hypothetical protein [Actinophytocola oryzae]TDV53997.1 hypothetical protein CLV71_104466 [Actinophytocola oryzae]